MMLNPFSQPVRAWTGLGLLVVVGGLGTWLISCQNSGSIEAPPIDDLYGAPFFQDVTGASGVRFMYRNGEEEPHYGKNVVEGKSPHYAILESLGGGLGLIDYDGDGKLDLFIAGGGYYDGPDLKQIKGHPNRLYKNLGGLKFQDVTKEVGLDLLADAQPLFYSHGCAVCDYDKDGWPDLLVTGYGRLALYRNVADGKEAGKTGGRKFQEVTKEAGLLDGRLGGHFWSSSAGFADLDGDGWPDLYVCQYVNWSFKNNPRCRGYHPGAKGDICPPKAFKSVPHALYRNDGKGRFIDVTKSAGIRVDRQEEVKSLQVKLDKLKPKLALRKQLDEKKDRTPAEDEQLKSLGRELDPLEHELERAKNDDFGKGLGVVIVDLNGDGKPDIYVANDTSDNFLYMNKSKPGHLLFEDVGQEMGVARDDNGTAQGSMGVDAGDVFGTGWPCLWTTNFEGELHALYRNTPKLGPEGVYRPLFSWATMLAGIAAIGQTYVGFGTGFLDIDNDGWEDIFISNGHVIRHPLPYPLAQKPVLFYNGSKGKFKDITSSEGPYFQTGHRGRGLAIGDLDNDGLPDMVTSQLMEDVAILRNVCTAKHNWLGIQLATKDNSTVVGAKLILEVDGRKLTRFAKGGCSYLSANDPRHIFGLGTAYTSGTLTVEWATGQPRRESWRHLTIGQYHTLVQGTGQR